MRRASLLVLTSASLVWVKVSHQPSTKSHAWGGNELCEAGRREVSGCNESECIEPRNNHRLGGRCPSFGSRQYSLDRKGEAKRTQRGLRQWQDTKWN